MRYLLSYHLGPIQVRVVNCIYGLVSKCGKCGTDYSILLSLGKLLLYWYLSEPQPHKAIKVSDFKEEKSSSRV